MGVGNASPGPEALRRLEDSMTTSQPVLTAHRGGDWKGWLRPWVGLVPPEECLPRATPARAAAASTEGTRWDTPLANTPSAIAQVRSVSPTPGIHRNAPALEPWVGPKPGEWEKGERDT